MNGFLWETRRSLRDLLYFLQMGSGGNISGKKGKGTNSRKHPEEHNKSRWTTFTDFTGQHFDFPYVHAIAALGMKIFKILKITNCCEKPKTAAQSQWGCQAVLGCNCVASQQFSCLSPLTIYSNYFLLALTFFPSSLSLPSHSCT